MNLQENIKRLDEILKKSKKILLINHRRMDPDCYGSLLALYNILNKAGYTVKATNDDEVQKAFYFMGNYKIIDNELNLKKYNPDLIISLDAASLDQLGNKYLEYKEVFEKSRFVVIDHHISNKGFGQLNIINLKSSSTCELLFEILEEIGLQKYIDSKIATQLLTGIYTDTNVFYNTNTTPKTLKISAKLIEMGADFRAPIFEFYKKKQFNKSKLWGEVLTQIQKDESNSIFWAVVTENMYKKTNTNENDLSGFINEFLSNMIGVKFAFLVYSLKDGTIKVSLRSSNEKYDVSKIASYFGGGGHKQAGGFLSKKSLEETSQELLKKLKKEL